MKRLIYILFISLSIIFNFEAAQALRLDPIKEHNHCKYAYGQVAEALGSGFRIVYADSDDGLNRMWLVNSSTAEYIAIIFATRTGRCIYKRDKIKRII